MDTIEHDIIIVGAGGAGMRAAIRIAEENPELSIGLISKVHPVRSHTVCAEGGVAAAIKPWDSEEQHAFDTIRGSDYLADQDAVEIFVKEAKDAVIELEHWGCPWSREEDGKMAVRLFGGMSVKRTLYAADKTGFYLMHSMFERSLQYENIKRYDEWYVTKLLTDEKGINGLIAIEMKTGKMAIFNTKAVIMATGGAGRIYAHSTNPTINTGDGMALAYEAGAALKDLEMVQFHPTTIPNGNLLISEAARGEGGHLVNKKGERFLKDYIPEFMEVGPRDLITRAIFEEFRKGNGFEGPNARYVELDIRHLGEKIIKSRLPTIRELSMTFMGIDPVKKRIPVTPAQHYFMGGIKTDTDTASTVPGLFAAGETACVTIHGANRMGSNSLAECLVFGARAAAAASAYAKKHHIRPPAEKQIDAHQKEISRLLKDTGKEKTAEITHEMRKTMEEYVGIVRDEKHLQKGLEKIKDLQERCERIEISDKSMVFNTELTQLLELKAMLTISEGVIISAIARKESRGSHYRSDYTFRDDSNFLHHHLIHRKENKTAISKTPVVITKWQPSERKY